ncbi:hypothetical protein HY409_00110 [Candidatus Gottesmanbacteria bacterium]|nr:hypothetical protein [Candidatus Gottesmanbacteria bacterium]
MSGWRKEELRIISPEEAKGFPSDAEIRAALANVQFFGDSGPISPEALRLHYVSGAGLPGVPERIPVIIVAPGDVVLHAESSRNRIIVSDEDAMGFKTKVLSFHHGFAISSGGRLAAETISELGTTSITRNHDQDGDSRASFAYSDQCVLTPDGSLYIGPGTPNIAYVMMFVGMTGIVPGLHGPYDDKDLQLGGTVVVNAQME